MEATDIDLCDPGNFVDSVPHEWFAYLGGRCRAVASGPRGFADGFWSVTRYDDAVTVNRD